MNMLHALMATYQLVFLPELLFQHNLNLVFKQCTAEAFYDAFTCWRIVIAKCPLRAVQVLGAAQRALFDAPHGSLYRC